MTERGEEGSGAQRGAAVPGQSGQGTDPLFPQHQCAKRDLVGRGHEGRDSRIQPASRHGNPPVYGALDLGTNNCRLLVARPSRRGFQVIDAFSRIIRLGEGVSQTGRLSDAAMARTMEALKVCSEKMERRNVHRSRLIATEACRIATNGGDFVGRVRQETGLDLEVVSRETEARLAVAGCASLLDRNCDWALVFDIGGGSTELIWLDLRRLNSGKRQSIGDRARVQAAIVAWTSLSVGVVTLAEKFGGRLVDACLFAAMVEDVVAKLLPFEKAHALARQVARGGAHLMGTSGTVTTIAGVHLGLETYSRSKVDGCWLNNDEIRTVSEGLLELSYEGRANQPCIGPERADLVLAGCAILEAIMRLWPCRRLRVADRGLREGILTSLMAEDARSASNGRHRF